MDLHDLLATAVDDLPPIADQAPVAAETLRRRRVRARRSLLAATCALAIGAGTVTIAAPWRHGARPQAAARPTAGPKAVLQPSSLPPTRFDDDAASVLQSLWPVPGQRLVRRAAQTIPGWPASQPVQTDVAFDVAVDGRSAYVGLIPQRFARLVMNGFTMNRCNATPPTGDGKFDYSCTSAALPDGVTVLLIRGAAGPNEPVDAELQLWKGSDALTLSVDGAIAQHIDDKQFFDLAENPGYASLFAQGEDSGVFAADVVTAVGG